MKFVLEQNCSNIELLGKKATILAQLEKIVDTVPRWFVISYKGFDINKKEIIEEAKDEILQKLKGFAESTLFVIKASFKNEEYSKKQYESFLAVKKEEVLEKIKEMYLLAFSEEAKNFRKENQIKEITIPSVIVQKMIIPEKSGYAYGANPDTSNVKEVVISAIYGINNKSDFKESDTYTICNDEINKNIERKNTQYIIEKNEIVQKEVEKKIRKKQILMKDEILQVKELVEKSGDLFGRFQEIEWLSDGNKIYIINSKPIMTLISPQNNKSKVELKENSSIIKNYEGIVKPLTFSFIRTVYENLYIEICKTFNVEKEKIELNSQMFKNILALVDGRVYYNVNGWHEMLEIFPELGKNKIHMEAIIGVNELEPENLLPVVQESNLKEKIEIIKNKYDVLSKTRKIKKTTDKFNSRIRETINNKNVKNMTLDELREYYYEIERRILAKWDAPLINEFLATIYQKQLKEQCIKYFQDEGNSLQEDLTCRENGIISANIAQRIKEMAEIARCDKSLLRLLEKDDVLYIKKNLIQYSSFYDEINEYLDLYSDRCIHELKLETKSLKEDPRSLYQAIAALARRMKEDKVTYIDYEKINETAEEKIKTTFKYNLVSKAKFEYILKYARYTIENKEKLRFERTRVFGKIRELFLRIGLILTSMDVLDEKRDILYLEVDEILNYIAGKSTTNNLKEVVELRKKQYKKYLTDEKKSKNTSKTTNLEKLKGTGISEGIAKGKAKVITNMDDIKIDSGEILVAEYSDPGWIMLFPKVEGILLEKERTNSYVAIVAKELGIPTIVNISGLMSEINNGDKIEFDTKTGQITKQ
ncbi:MAG: PEP/pyruvate-binding domain-containing protein [Clostridia bacterium]